MDTNTAAHRLHSCGFVYVMTNPYMSGCVKVGFTSRLAEDRASELSRTSVPKPFEVAHRLLTSWPREVEHAAHTLLDDTRIDPHREFFACSCQRAVDAVEAAARQAAGIGLWRTERPHPMKHGSHIVVHLKRDDLMVFLGMSDALMGARWRPIDLWLAHSDRDWIELHGVRDGDRVAAVDSESPIATEDPVPHLDRVEQTSNDPLVGKDFLVPGERLVTVTRQEDGAYESACFEARDYVQIFGRSRRPQVMAGGVPLLMHFADRDYPDGAISAVMPWLAQGSPRAWAPRSEFPGFAIPRFGSRASAASQWLPQLDPKRRS